jgi:hypothetical protein
MIFRDDLLLCQPHALGLEQWHADSTVSEARDG